ncbi:MATE family efflux transporter [Parabacteroides sp. PF5-9]|uniref:MATE family efflux transporter n=1 Tax=Parabacteroides sp. PF5-9 TaxID=1742404 RepID=UPI002473B147|nr:MATE family efflux transporter [Parabacteroides sp. PF5-9]MDH6358628.1 MATE family multidrug resistance protein [Parabacteroides sp. PF5-9]
MKNFYQIYREHYKTLIYLGVPIIIGQVGMIILAFADTLMIGHHSTNELGAASFVNNMFNLAIIFSTGFSYGLTPVVGNLFGHGESQGIGRLLKNSLLANTIVGLLLTLIMTVFYFNIERLDQPVELIPLIKPYFIILLVSLIFILLFNGFKQFADGITDTRTPMWILLGGNLVNIVGNYVLIYGKLGFPEMGLIGAGMSTLFSRILMLLVFILVFFKAKRYSVYVEGFKKSCLNKPDFKKLNNLGWPIGLQMGMETASFSLSTIMIGWIGTIALASHQIMMAVSQLGFMIYYGMGAAVAVMVSNYRGKGDIQNVRRSASAGFHLIMVMAVFVSVLLYLLRNQIGGWFTDSEEVTIMVASLILPFIIYQFGDGLQIAYANALRGISDVRPMMFIAFVAYFVVSLPLGYFFGFVMNWGSFGVWLAFPFGLTTAGILFYLRFRQQTKN